MRWSIIDNQPFFSHAYFCSARRIYPCRVRPLNDFMRNERLPDDLKISEIVTIFKQKGDAMECGNYRGIKLLEIGLKVYERVIERRIRQQVTIQDNQFGFMKGRGTTDAIFILRQTQEKVLEGNEKRYWT